MTRKRTRESLVQLLTEPCPTCEGAGVVKSVTTVAYEILREVRRSGTLVDNEKIEIECAPRVAEVLAAPGARLSRSPREAVPEADHGRRRRRAGSRISSASPARCRRRSRPQAAAEAPAQHHARAQERRLAASGGGGGGGGGGGVVDAADAVAIARARRPGASPSARARMKHRIVIAREQYKFSCAHMTVFPDGTKERLHGHNYTIAVALEVDQIGLAVR